MNLKGRDFLKEIDFSKDEFLQIIETAEKLKKKKKSGKEKKYLKGKNIALIFEKTSTRTRAAFDVAAHDQGAFTTFFDSSSSQLGHKESISDTAQVLDKMFDAIEYRGFAQESVEELAKFSKVPVFNGLTDLWHPTQMLADVLTMKENSNKKLNDISFAYLGDARNNMGNSLLVTAALLGMDVRLVAPKSLVPKLEIQEIASNLSKISGARITITEDVAVGVRDVDFIHTDVWVSMGEPENVWNERINLLNPYRVTREVMELTNNKNVKFMHCLPAYYDDKTLIGKKIKESFGIEGIEVTKEVFQSSNSIVFDQAENRMHTIKALLVETLA
ncbi:MAG: ornithine carbamoyltransferase [Candidatus Nanopelagicales bacterium]